MRKFYYLFLSLFLLSIVSKVEASHVMGGEVTYTFVSKSGNNYTYNVCHKEYIDWGPNSNFQNVGGFIPNRTYGIYDKSTNALVQTILYGH